LEDFAVGKAEIENRLGCPRPGLVEAVVINHASGKHQLFVPHPAQLAQFQSLPDKFQDVGEILLVFCTYGCIVVAVAGNNSGVLARYEYAISGGEGVATWIESIWLALGFAPWVWRWRLAVPLTPCS
jgi:hypothetical protein